MLCHGSPTAAPAPAGTAVVALVGMPNTGKSTLFNRLTGGHAHIANWPGLTVDLLRGRLPADAEGRPFELVDLPGVHDLCGRSEDEAIVQRFNRSKCLIPANRARIMGRSAIGQIKVEEISRGQAEAIGIFIGFGPGFVVEAAAEEGVGVFTELSGGLRKGSIAPCGD